MNVVIVKQAGFAQPREVKFGDSILVLSNCTPHGASSELIEVISLYCSPRNIKPPPPSTKVLIAWISDAESAFCGAPSTSTSALPRV